MILCGGAAGILGMLLSKRLIKARNGEVPEKGLITGRYAPIFWAALGSAGFGLIQFLENDSIQRAEYASVFIICVCIAAVDFSIRKIPNSLLLSLIGTKAIFLALEFSGEALSTALWGFGAACVIFILPSLFKIKVGAGDIKLAAITGLYLGMYGFLQAMIIMAIAVTAYGVYLVIKRSGGFRTKTAMGPYLALGMICTLLFPLL